MGQIELGMIRAQKRPWSQHRGREGMREGGPSGHSPLSGTAGLLSSGQEIIWRAFKQERGLANDGHIGMGCRHKSHKYTLQRLQREK